MRITVEELESIDDGIFGIYVGQHVGGVVRISCHSFFVRDIRRNDRRMIQRVASFRLRAGQSLRIAAVETHMRQGSDRGGTHVFA